MKLGLGHYDHKNIPDAKVSIMIKIITIRTKRLKHLIYNTKETRLKIQLQLRI